MIMLIKPDTVTGRTDQKEEDNETGKEKPPADNIKVYFHNACLIALRITKAAENKPEIETKGAAKAKKSCISCV